MRSAWILGGLTMLAFSACSIFAADETTTTTSSTTVATTVATTIPTTTSTTIAETTTTTEPPPALNEESNVTLRALGPVILGMTVEEAAIASGLTMTGELDPEVSDNCYYVTPGPTMKGVSFMVFDDLIVRIEIDEPSPVTTRSGAGIGSTTDDLITFYPDNIGQANEAVFDGEAMGFVPNDESDATYRIFFELDEDGVVFRYRVGIRPAVDFIEGCL